MNSNDQHKTPIVLIHGLWMTPTSWNTWAEYFRARGHEVIVPGWPGAWQLKAEATSALDRYRRRG